MNTHKWNGSKSQGYYTPDFTWIVQPDFDGKTWVIYLHNVRMCDGFKSAQAAKDFVAIDLKWGA